MIRLAALAALGIVAGSLALRADGSPGFAWAENAGWISRHNNNGTTAVGTTLNRVYGLAWGENIGWINLGEANTPTNEWPRIDRDPETGKLTGYAWGQAIGWIRFGGDAAASDPARLTNDRKFAGFAWAENLGWINLEGWQLPADTDWDGTLDADEPDTDGDGIPDDVEIAADLDPTDHRDSDDDTDGDGWTNRDEYRAGTAINDATDHPRVTGISQHGDQMQVHTNARNGRRYALAVLDKLRQPQSSDFQPLPANARDAWYDSALLNDGPVFFWLTVLPQDPSIDD